MKHNPDYTLYHPRWYRERVSTYWWTRKWSHFKFILRELTSLAVAYFVLLVICLLRAVGDGQESYNAMQEWLATPVAIVVNLIAFCLILFHTITWFNLAPRAMPVRVGGKRLADWMVAAPNYVAWLVISAIVAWIVIGD